MKITLQSSEQFSIDYVIFVHKTLHWALYHDSRTKLIYMTQKYSL